MSILACKLNIQKVYNLALIKKLKRKNVDILYLPIQLVNMNSIIKVDVAFYRSFLVPDGLLDSGCPCVVGIALCSPCQNKLGF